MYLAGQRRQYLLRLLAERGELRGRDIARELQVTEETIRTDLVALEKQGQLVRTHGGALYKTSQHVESNPAASILSPLLSLLSTWKKDDGSIYLEDSPLTRLLLALLPQENECHFVTNALPLLLHLAPAAQKQPITCLGGQLDKESELLIPSTEDAIPPIALGIHCPDKIKPDMSLCYKKQAAASWARRVAAHSGKSHAIVRACDIVHRIEAYHCCDFKLHTLYSEDDLPADWKTMPDCTLHLATLAEKPEYDSEWY